MGPQKVLVLVLTRVLKEDRAWNSIGWFPCNNILTLGRLDLRASIIDPYERWLVREFKQKSAVSVFAIVDLSASVRFHGLQNGKNLITKILTSVMNSVRRYGDRFGLIGFDNKFRQDWFMPATQRVPVNFDTLNLQFSLEKLGGVIKD